MPEIFVSDIEICNMALDHLGAKSNIESFEDKSPEARVCKRWYNPSRRGILAAYDWGWARKRITMALHGDTISETASNPLAGVWGFRYQYPADCVKARKIQNPNSPPMDQTPFAVETSLDGTELTILTNAEDAVLVYTWDQTQTNMFSELFVLALPHLLASNIAYTITGKRNITNDEFTIYQGIIAGASAADANERSDAPPRDADWIRARTV